MDDDRELIVVRIRANILSDMPLKAGVRVSNEEALFCTKGRPGYVDVVPNAITHDPLLQR